MALSFFDYVIVTLFLLGTLILGVRASYGVKSIRDYALANRTYSAPVLFMTLTATIIGGAGTIGTVSNVYQQGLLFVIATLGYVISLFMVTKFIVPKFDERFDGMISAGDILQKFYGNEVEKFSAAIVCVFSVGILTAQMIAIGHVMRLLSGIEYQQTLLIFGLIIISYSAFGGIKSVVSTDVLQFIIMAISLPILTYFALTNAGGVGPIVQHVAELDPSKFIIFENDSFKIYFILFILYLFPMSLGPSVIQRFLMSKHRSAISKMMYGYIITYLIVLACATCIAFSAIVLIEDVSSKEIIPYMIVQYLPVGVKGLVLAGIIGIVMSTADSYLNTASVFCTHNLLPQRFNNLKVIRIATALIGATSMFIASFDGNLIFLLLFCMALLYIGVTLPIIMVIMRFEVSRSSYWLSVGLAFPVFAVGQTVYKLGFTALLAAVAVATIVSLVSVVWKARMALKLT